MHDDAKETCKFDRTAAQSSYNESADAAFQKVSEYDDELDDKKHEALKAKHGHITIDSFNECTEKFLWMRGNPSPVVAHKFTVSCRHHPLVQSLSPFCIHDINGCEAQYKNTNPGKDSDHYCASLSLTCAESPKKVCEFGLDTLKTSPSQSRAIKWWDLCQSDPVTQYYSEDCMRTILDCSEGNHKQCDLIRDTCPYGKNHKALAKVSAEVKTIIDKEFSYGKLKKCEQI